MYKVIEIGGNEYKLEYSFEASLYKDCVTSVVDIIRGMSDEDDQDSIINSIADLPKVAITVFCAGLLEHHGVEGDNTVPNLRTARRLAKTWILEQGEDGNFYDLFTMCTNQMGEDGFFKRVGLEQMLNQTEEEVQKPTKAPQDHKRKTTRKKTTEA